MRSKDAGDRRAVLKVLKAVRESTQWLTRQWTAESELWDFDAPRDANDNVVRRERREDEYPENSQQAWNDLASVIEDQIHGLRSLQLFAREQASRPKFTADNPRFPHHL